MGTASLGDAQFARRNHARGTRRRVSAREGQLPPRQVHRRQVVGLQFVACLDRLAWTLGSQERAGLDSGRETMRFVLGAPRAARAGRTTVASLAASHHELLVAVGRRGLHVRLAACAHATAESRRGACRCNSPEAPQLQAKDASDSGCRGTATRSTTDDVHVENVHGATLHWYSMRREPQQAPADLLR